MSQELHALHELIHELTLSSPAVSEMVTLQSVQDHTGLTHPL